MTGDALFVLLWPDEMTACVRGKSLVTAIAAYFEALHDYGSPLPDESFFLELDVYAFWGTVPFAVDTALSDRIDEQIVAALEESTEVPAPVIVRFRDGRYQVAEVRPPSIH